MPENADLILKPEALVARVLGCPALGCHSSRGEWGNTPIEAMA